MTEQDRWAEDRGPEAASDIADQARSEVEVITAMAQVAEVAPGEAVEGEHGAAVEAGEVDFGEVLGYHMIIRGPMPILIPLKTSIWKQDLTT